MILTSVSLPAHLHMFMLQLFEIANFGWFKTSVLTDSLFSFTSPESVPYFNQIDVETKGFIENVAMELYVVVILSVVITFFKIICYCWEDNPRNHWLMDFFCHYWSTITV